MSELAPPQSSNKMTAAALLSAIFLQLVLSPAEKAMEKRARWRAKAVHESNLKYYGKN